MTATTEPFPGILPPRLVTPQPGDPVLRGLRMTTTREPIREILVRHGVTWEQITQTKARYTGYVRARIEIANMLREKGYSYSRIGKLMRRHHTTVLYWMGRVAHTRRKLHGVERRYD